MKPLCRHCNKQPPRAARGLCWACYQKPAVRQQYRPSKVTKPERTIPRVPFVEDEPQPGDPSAVEIAEFAAWWAAAEAKLDALSDIPRMCRVYT